MKKILEVLLVILMVLAMAGCGNKMAFDATYTFNRAIISLPDGTIVDGKVTAWTDYEDGDQIQVVVDGNTYLVHSEDIALIK